MSLSRRDFLMRVGQAGGYSAAFTMMQSLGLLPVMASAAATVEHAAGSGKGISVVILGGGIAGLVSAYELGKLGYNCTLLEARSAPEAGTGPFAMEPGSISPTARRRPAPLARVFTRM
jgi:monoamine oxidase